ncbi:TRAP transporter large permease [uncultured Sneathiella sp.]|uniref:TRAP transporter large permease n=1 Tax=uncultured Sneathiella sp. TaxID=879315 RepID=UPI0030DA3C0C|tara:strand:+ start:951 stop:2264 length:1314 start_codon:yes stop_codon:yes gene_type:complete
MDSLTIGFIGLGISLFLMALRVPIAIALGLVSFIGIMIIRGAGSAFTIIGSVPFDFAASWTLSAIPMYLLMGAFAYHAKITTALFDAARTWFGRLPGGVAVATNFACAGFASVSGSSLATAAAMGRIAIPEMLRLKYNEGLAAASAAAGGTLGALIPPSIMLVIFGWLAEVSVGQLLMAGVVPGILTALMYSGMIILRCSLNPSLAPRLEIRPTWSDRISVLTPIWPVPLLVVSILVGIYTGIVTPTEAGAFGAFVVFMMALCMRNMTWKTFRESLREALVSTSSIFFIAISAIIFTRFLALSGLPNFLSQFVSGIEMAPLAIVLVTSVIYLILGMFLDPLGILLITLPILLPVFREANIDMIWMGIILIKYIEIGLLTPPVGLNVFVVKSVVGDRIPIMRIFGGMTWFLLAEAIIMVLLIAFPEITLTLPNMMAGS